MTVVAGIPSHCSVAGQLDIGDVNSSVVTSTTNHQARGGPRRDIRASVTYLVAFLLSLFNRCGADAKNTGSKRGLGYVSMAKMKKKTKKKNAGAILN